MQVRQRAQQLPQLLVKVSGRLGQAEKVLPLAYPDDHADPGGKAGDDRRRDVAHHRAQARDPEQHQDAAGHERGQLQAGDAVLAGDAGQDHDEGAGGAGDLQAAAAEYRDGQAGDDGGVQPLLRLGSGSDGKGHGQRQGDDADDDPGNDIGQPMFAAEQAGAVGFEKGDHFGRQDVKAGAGCKRLILKAAPRFA